MPTRRKTLFALSNALVGSAAIGSGALESVIATPTADMRVVTTGRGLPYGIKLKPGREDEAYVRTTDEGFVKEILLNGLTAPGDGINQKAEVRFENLVRICNEPPGPPIEELYFEFEVTGHGLGAMDPTPDEIEQVLFIASAGGDIPGNGNTDFLSATDHGQTGADKITPNEELPFGIGINLLPSSPIQSLPSPEKYSVALRIRAKIKETGKSPNP